jgi:DNA polymerase-3 subunit delta
VAGPHASERDVVAEVRRGEIAPVYYVYGKERFLVTRAANAIRDAVLEERSRAFNLDVIDCKEVKAPGQRIVAAARTLPMLAQRRLVLVRDADEFGAPDFESLSEYLADPAPTTCLLMVAATADQRRRFFTDLKKVGVIAKYDSLYERQLRPWVEGEARGLGVSLERGAADLLCEVIGADLAQLASALEQLTLYAGKRKRITVADVEEVVAETRQHSVFDLANAVGERDTRRALHQLRQMLAAREAAPKILFMLTRHFRQLWTAQELLARRASRNAIAEAVGIRPFFVESLCEQARRLSSAALRRAFEALYAADRSLKASRLGDELTLERLVLELCEAGSTA